MKHNTMQKPAFRLAFCAAVAALETVCKWAFGVYGVAAVLSFFVSGDKEAVVLFALLFGYYPILKNILERHISQKVILWIVKYALFNAAAVGSFFIATLLLAVPAEEFTLFGVYVPYVFLLIGNVFFWFLLIGNVFFWLYDRSIGVFVQFYVQRLRGAMFGKK